MTLDSGSPLRNGSTSFYLHDIGSSTPTHPPLAGDLETDVCIIGAGYTGLWTAYWLRTLSPDLSVHVLEAHRVGFGASGRNLGWMSGKTVGHPARLAETPAGRAGVVALRRACIDAIPQILEVTAQHGVDIDADHCGYLHVARTPAGLERVRRQLAEREVWGLTDADLSWVGQDELHGRLDVAGALGGLYSPHCVRIQPAKLALGLGDVVRRLGVIIHEGTPATGVRAHRVDTPSGVVRARSVLLATEAYTVGLPGRGRSILPMRSSVIATEPLSSAEAAEIGWAGGEALYGAEHRSFFALRTADDRIVLAGRGRPYRFGSGFDDAGRVDHRTVGQLKTLLHQLFPGISPQVAHAWCGEFGVTRDWSPSVGFDAVSGLGQAGGYAGQGVTAAYLAGRTLADLVMGTDSTYTRLPWTRRPVPEWEPEPLRWVGAYSMYGMYRMADALERRSGRPRTSAVARLATGISRRP